jgi:hypothetical protein
MSEWEQEMTTVEIHRLLKKDPLTQTGECSVCGLVAIRKAGNGFMCGEKKKQAQAAWRAKNPAKSSADRRRRSDHELFNQDRVQLTAACAVCGPVSIVFWGRGYACATRAGELRSVQESGRQEPCRECWIIDGSKVYPVDGQCPRCADPRLSDLGSSLKDGEHRSSDMEGTPHGFMVVDLEHSEAEDMDDDEAVVFGWNRRSGRVLGSSVRAWNEV